MTLLGPGTHFGGLLLRGANPVRARTAEEVGLIYPGPKTTGDQAGFLVTTGV
jgi:hypothetical protein